MKEEMDYLIHNHTWGLVYFQVGKITLENKWVYRLKEEDGGKNMYKARLVLKGLHRRKVYILTKYFLMVLK